MDPLPRYTSGKCCPSPDHISNFGDADYLETIEAAVGAAHKALVADLAALPITTFMDPMEGFQAVEGVAVSSAGLSIWADNVHLTPTAYSDIWARLSDASTAASLGGGPPTLRYPAIVNMPIDRRMVSETTAPGWLTGRPDQRTSSWSGSTRGPPVSRDGRSERTGRHRFAPY